MNSEEMNIKIRELCDGGDIDGLCGKSVAYIGWFWRDVDFSEDYYDFGVIPAGVDSNKKNFVGFMENNKWGYPCVSADGPKWNKIIKLILKSIEIPIKENLEKLNYEVQSLASDKKYIHVSGPYGCDSWEEK